MFLALNMTLVSQTHISETWTVRHTASALLRKRESFIQQIHKRTLWRTRDSLRALHES
jgi:hypothetical protein